MHCPSVFHHHSCTVLFLNPTWVTANAVDDWRVGTVGHVKICWNHKNISESQARMVSRFNNLDGAETWWVRLRSCPFRIFRGTRSINSWCDMNKRRTWQENNHRWAIYHDIPIYSYEIYEWLWISGSGSTLTDILQVKSDKSAPLCGWHPQEDILQPSGVLIFVSRPISALEFKRWNMIYINIHNL